MDDTNDYQILVVQGAEYKTKFTRKFINRKFWENPNLNHIYSFIPGTIIDIFVKTGEKVHAGQTLLMLEAMKMHNQVRMPFDGEIVKIHVKKDQVIPKNQILLEIRQKNT